MTGTGESVLVGLSVDEAVVSVGKSDGFTAICVGVDVAVVW
jgi:hypothetical protein